MSSHLCCAVLCCAVLCCAVLCCAVLCCAVLCCAVLCCAVLCCAACCAVLCCAVLCCAAPKAAGPCQQSSCSRTAQKTLCAQHCNAVVLQLSPECVAAAENVDLVVVEGMGRAIETNLYASFSCDSLKLAMVKHPEVRFALSATICSVCNNLLCLQQQHGPLNPALQTPQPPEHSWTLLTPCPVSTPHLLGIIRPPSLDSIWVKLTLCQHSTTCMLYHISNAAAQKPCCARCAAVWRCMKSQSCFADAACHTVPLLLPAADHSVCKSASELYVCCTTHLARQCMQVLFFPVSFPFFKQNVSFPFLKLET